MWRRSVVLAVVALLMLIGAPDRAEAATITVSNLNDSGPGSLRQAIADAAAGDTIDFAVTGTITLTSGELTINKDLMVNGPGAANLAISGNDASRVLHTLDFTSSIAISGVTIRDGNTTGSGCGVVNDSATLTLTEVMITSNAAGHPNDGGGGIGTFGSSGTVELVNSTVNGNTATNGGGIFSNFSTLILTNSTLSNNVATEVGGGIVNAFGTMTLTNSTVSYNTATSGGGILDVLSAGDTSSLTNTIVANNTAGSDCSASITSLGHNLDSDGSCNFAGTGDISGVDPLLGPLEDNGGATETHALAGGSPAIDAGDNSPCPAVDQRGYVRPQLSACDIGAFELQPPDLSITKADSVDPASKGGPLTYTIVVSNAGLDPATNVVVTDNLPGGVTFGSATPSQGGCVGTSTLMCNLGTVNNGATATVVISVTAPSEGGSISNIASVSASGTDSDLSNNSTVEATNVPSLSQWALTGLAAALAGLVYLKLKRRVASPSF